MINVLLNINGSRLLLVITTRCKYFDPCYCREGPFLSGWFSDGSYLAHVNGAYLRHVTFCIIRALCSSSRIISQRGPASVRGPLPTNSARLVQSPRRRLWRGWTNVQSNTTCVPYFTRRMWWAALFDKERPLSGAVNLKLNSPNSPRVLMVDFSSAFNTIQPHLMMQKLMSMALNPNIILWVQQFLTGRLQRVCLGTTRSGTIRTNTGAPQGCVISPVLFTLYTNDCVSTHDSCEIIKYADDTAILGKVNKGKFIPRQYVLGKPWRLMMASG